MGIAISVFVSFLTFFAIYSLIVTGQRSQIFNFASLAQVAMGRFGYHMLNFMLFVQSAGSVISYFILVGDTIPVLLGFYIPQFPILADRQLVTILISLFIIFPLNLFRSIGALAKWSAFSVLLLPIMIFSVLFRAPVYSKDHTAPLMTVGKDPFAAMGIMSFAFVCSQVAFQNYLSQKNQTTSSWKISSVLSTCMSWTISMSFAAIGYLSFGQDVNSNVFSNFPEDDHIINIGRLALGLSMVLTVPMAFYPARDAVQKTIGFETKDCQPNALQHYGVTAILFLIFLVLGVQIHSLGKVYSVVGGIASSFLAYIIPGSAYIAVFHPQWFFLFKNYYHGAAPPNNDESSSIMGSGTEVNLVKVPVNPTWWLDIAAIVLVIFGFLIMTYTAISAFVI
ncbi:transmembrane amino acid transporter protein-domain-containing protein [Mycotypha africana]|uniref:transmembrane amino acid transporter protein-domain-containing protein n=1 Tax=Mycotypha africana TaxID=64632 RepID=UPI002300F06A|nr:transmembrane amino acid transporter protein-domain-containing protein [Mycotypha africana]KAI8991737.1 transmembrane amino acid transporter protein-domain-containing protein [Mycotypha africana]